MPRHWVSALFEHFARVYLHKWTSAIAGDEDGIVSAWAKELAGLTGEDIRRGLEAWQGDWPPNAKEFRKACLHRPKNDFGLDYVPAYYRQPERRPDRLLDSDELKARRKENRKYVLQIMKMLKGGNDVSSTDEH